MFLVLKTWFKKSVKVSERWPRRTEYSNFNKKECFIGNREVFPQKMSFLRQLLQEDYSLQLDYAEIIHHDFNNASGYLKRTLFSDESIFHTFAAVTMHILKESAA